MSEETGDRRAFQKSAGFVALVSRGQPRPLIIWTAVSAGPIPFIAHVLLF